MGMGLALLGGALTGVGTGITEVAKTNEEERYQMALKALEEQYRSAELQQTADLTNRNKADEQYRGAVYDAANDARTTATALKVKEVEHGYKEDEDTVAAGLKYHYDSLLEGLKHQNNLSEKAAELAQTQSDELARLHVEVGHVETTKNGNVVFFDKTGHTISFTQTGHFVAPKGADDSGGSISDALNRRGSGAPPVASATAGTAPTPAVTPAASGQRAQALSQLGMAYPNATPDQYPGFFNPDGSKKPIAELEAIIASRYPG
jgi:hypothetical protein